VPGLRDAPLRLLGEGWDSTVWRAGEEWVFRFPRREMVVPGILVVAFPVIVGLVLKAEAMASFLMVGTMAGILMATVLNNAGGSWDNAKKFIESGELTAKKIGTSYRIKRSALDEYLAR